MTTVASKADMMREFVSFIESNDFDKASAMCTDDLTWESSNGTFLGKEGLKRYINWMAETVEDYKITETGSGIIEQGDKALFEHTMSGVIEGEKVSFLAMCVYEFSGEKISKLRTVFDRLAIAEQASSQWLPKKIVNTVVNQMQKGL